MSSNRDVQGCVHRYDEGAKVAPSHCDMGSSEQVSGWIQNDRSLYYLHETGIL